MNLVIGSLLIMTVTLVTASVSIFLLREQTLDGEQHGSIELMVNLVNMEVTIHGWPMDCGSLTLKANQPI